MKLGKYVLNPERVDYSASGLIVCEGFSDAMFVDALLREHGINSLQIGCPTQRTEGVKKDGRDGIPDYLLAVSTHANKDKLKGILVVVDAETSSKTAFSQMRQGLYNAGFHRPAKRDVIEAGSPATGVYVLPGNGKQGCLEDLLIRAAVGARPKMKGCLKRFIACADHTAAWSKNKKAKMQVGIIIASGCKDDPASSLSKVWIEKTNPIPANSSEFHGIVGVINQLVQTVTA